MNTFCATVRKIEQEQSLHIVEFARRTLRFFMMSLEIPHVKVGSKVTLSIKPTHLSIAKNFSGQISFSNRFESTIKEIEMGKLLCSVVLQSDDLLLQSVVTAKNAQKMNLQIGDRVLLFAKASEVSIVEVNDE